MVDEARIQEVYEAMHAPLAAAYPDQEPFHYGTLIGWAIGGPDPLDGVSIYWHPSGHWHYVSVGMTELADKESNNPEVSGWGFELTFRLEAPADVAQGSGRILQGYGERILEVASAAPKWPIALLNTLARQVYETRRPYGPGHYAQLAKGHDPDGALTRLAFIDDPSLPITSTPNGKFRWLQVFGLVDDAELEAMKGDDYQRFLATFRARDPLFVTRVGRPSFA